MIKKLILALAVLFLLSNSVFAVEKPQKYMPYPIIFVSGIRTTKTSPSTSWPSTKVFREFKKYFLLHPEAEESKESKYEFADIDKLQEGERPNLEFFFYDSKEAPIDKNANILKNEIEKILSVKDGGYYKPDTYTYVDPCPAPKVIIIAHSYGGIITRYMLANNIGNIRDKVAAVFFLGVPQLGSPMAVVGYFLPKEIPYLMEDIRNIDDTLRKEDFTDRIWDEINFKLVRKYERQKLIGNLKFIKWAESQEGLYTSVRDIFDNAAIENAIANDYQLLALYREIPPVYQKGVVWATLIPDAQANTYRKKFELYNPSDPDKPFVRYIPREGNLTYDLSKSVLSSLGTNIGVEKVHAIAGKKDDLIREYLCGKADDYMFGHFDRLDYNCIKNGLWNDGDGVINLASQKAIPGVESLNTHVIDAAHVSFLSPILLTGEPDHEDTPNIILKAIDDAPVIESIEVTSEFAYARRPTYNYVTVKVRDYLLADIEIVDMRVNDRPVDLSSFFDPETETNRPYFRYSKDGKDGKDFLKQRIDTNHPYGPSGYYLMPGEFGVIVGYPSVYNVYIKVRNAAGKEASREKCFICEARNIFKMGYASGSTENGCTWPTVKQQAYASFKESSKAMIDVAYADWFMWRLYRMGIQASSGDCLYEKQEEDGSKHIEHNFFASIDMYYGPWIIFKLIPPPEEIKSIKLIVWNLGYIVNDSHNKDFNVLLYHDTYNSWPPTPISSADKFLLSYGNKENYYKELDIDPQDIGPDGYYVLQFRPDFQESNCILDPPIDGQATFQRVGYVPNCLTGYWPNYNLFLDVELKSAEPPSN